MGETEEFIREQILDPALTNLPESAPKPKNGTSVPMERDVTSAAHAPCFIVGIGASAGGHEPLEHIFTTIPTDCNFSLVVIMHIPAEGPSLLADLIRRYTSMEVLPAEEGMPLQPNTVHVIPPGVMLSVKEGRLRLDPSDGPRRMHHPIDRFFTSLAAEYGKRAIAVVLSGYGMDGSEGVKRIKEGGGIVLVQEPTTTINPSMPQYAIATGAVDMVLPAEEISDRIAEIARGQCHLLPQACLTTTIDEELHTLFAILKTRTGHDFSSYKKNTILRRIERRMTINEAGGIKKYLAILEENPQEAQALCQELLIGVTSFFRDPETFELIRSEIIPRLFADRDPEDPVRIWHACCATGEEAYSVAMLIQEHLEKERLQAKVQIFATDIDEAAVAQARAGLYSNDIEPEVGEDRLNHFFTKYDGRWQLAKRIREMVVFAHHSIIKDPPFSRLDLLVCRNFLIYLDPDMQKKLISLFHMVLKPGGFLFLGGSESVGRNSELFTAVDKKWKIFRRLESSRRDETFFPFSSPARKLIRNAPSKHPAEAGEPAPWDVAERRFMERYAPPCVIVNEKFEVLHTTTKTQRYMEVPVGDPTQDILRMAREELRPALRAAIYKAFMEQKQVAFRGVKINAEAGEAAVSILVEPIAVDPAYGKLAMVILEPAPSPALPPAFSGGEALPGDESSKDMLNRQLEEQLRITHEQLQVTSEQLETSNEAFLSANEELMSINEEFQSTNEELQSTNEELETSKEELQALNEELATVNSELQGKVEELNQSNSDMENLFANSEIATIFLDRGLIIKRFSPAMAAIFNLIPADIGRPFRHLAGTIDWSGLPRDAQAVLEKLEPVEREVTALEDGKSFIMRVLPYWATDGRIGGIVVTLIDITARKQAEEDHARLAALVESSDDAIIAKNLNGTILSWNTGSERLFGYRADEVIGKPITLLLPQELREEEDKILRRLSAGIRIEPFETVRLTKDGHRVEVSVTASPIKDGQGRIVGASKIARDITSRKQAEEALRLAKEEWERTFDSVPDLIAILDNKHRVLRVNEAMASCLGLKPEECVGLPCYEAVHGTSVPPEFCPHSRTLEDGREHIEEVHEARLGCDLLVTTTPLHDEQGLMIGSVHVARDITERKQAEEERQTSVDFLRLMNESRTSADLIRAATLFFHEKSGCEAVGIRLKDGDDYPYFEAHGFPEEFVILENRLCDYNERGEVVRDSKGDPIIECMCGNVICGRFDPSKPLFTNTGSFWTNCTTELLASTTEADRQARTRNRCNGQGYESVALIPLRLGEERLGLLQLNDRQQGRFSPATIALWERLSGYLSVALTKFKTEEALHESEERFRTLANAIPQLCWMANADGWIFWYNQRWYEYTGTTPEQMEGWGWQSVHDPEVLPKVLEQWKASISTAKPFDMVFPLRGSDGIFRTFLTRGLPEYDHDGKVVRWFGTNTDISESKRAEEALRTSYQRTDLLADATARLLASDSPQKVIDELCRRVMGVLDCQAFFNFMVDEETGRLHLNACAGIPAEEVKKLEWLDYGVAVCGCAARDATRIVAEDIANTPDPRTELVKSYGIQAYACHPLMAHGRVLGTLSFGTRNRPGFTDDELTLMKTVADHVAIAMERKLAEEDLKLAREAAEAASQAKSQFLANMSHELRTPMTGVLGMLEFALNTALDEQQQDFIETAQKSARTLLRILNDILDLAKVEAGKLSLEEKPFDLHDCVSGAIDILVPEARRKGLELNYAIADDLPKTVIGDHVRLLQVLTNLLGNAVKYTERGEVKITVKTGPQTPVGKREINFIVADSGIGIPAEKKEIIFQSFTQADESHSRRYGGVGLGLAISRELVERMGGTITCESEEGNGSTFSFTIPFGYDRSLIESPNMPAPPPVTAIPVSSSNKRKARLLLAEDDPTSRKVIGTMLQYSDFDLDIAENGLQAVELWEKGNYDLILMDVQMPGLDGFAATGAIREKERANGSHTLIVAMTAHALKEDEKRCLDAGMDAYMSKPIVIKECIAMIGDLIEKQAQEAL